MIKPIGLPAENLSYIPNVNSAQSWSLKKFSPALDSSHEWELGCHSICDGGKERTLRAPSVRKVRTESESPQAFERSGGDADGSPFPGLRGTKQTHRHPLREW